MVKSLLKGMEGAFIPVKDVELSAKWYEEILGFTIIYIEKEAAVMRIADKSQTVICLVRTSNHQPMKFPENNFGVGEYYHFIPNDIVETYKYLLEKNVKVSAIEDDVSTY